MNWDFQQWLIVGLFASLFFKEEFKSLVLHYFGVKQPEDRLQAGMDYLKLHFNDELSHILTDIQVEQKDGFKELSEKVEAVRDCTKKANDKLDVFERFGIKSRS